jgi:hypothetical protein
MLQALAQVGTENNRTVILPIALDLVRGILARASREGG